MSDDRPLADLTDQQLSDYCGDVDANALSTDRNASTSVILSGEACVAEVNARGGRQ